NKVIAEKNSSNQIEPASLTKMMSTYVIENELQLGNIKLTDEVLISNKAWKMPGSRMFVEVNTKVTVEKLLKGIIIQSGNDATVAMAEYIAGSEDSFVSLMNEYARQLGMKGTHFVNVTGLPHKKHYTTAEDLALLVAAMIRNFPEHYSWYSEKVFTYNGIKQYNRNKLLWQDKYVDGVKTGHTDSAGYCLAASALRDDMRLISVVLGTKSERARATESQKLLTFGFRFYETHRLYESNKSLTTAQIWKGEQEKLALGLAEDLWITIPRGLYGSLKATMSLDAKIVAPVKQGGVYGAVDVKLEGKPFISRDLVALKDVREGGFVGGMIDEVKMLFE
ncbi:MAG: D-alanyl-D-alanine carboxypeptidase, partial [Gammaproteobacteria bacterium]|nr:D-alanyl-D-alanine carboxypeptidase [Gammaproteobacteria bacterium]